MLSIAGIAGWSGSPVFVTVTPRRPRAAFEPTGVRYLSLLRPLSELGIGAGWFPKKHDLKLQGDLFWLPVGENFGNGSWQARVQLQLYF